MTCEWLLREIKRNLPAAGTRAGDVRGRGIDTGGAGGCVHSRHGSSIRTALTP